MQDLKKNKRKMMNKNQAPMTNDAEVYENYVEESIPCEISRACKKPIGGNEDDCGCNKPHKHENDCGCNKPHKHDCDCGCNKPHHNECECHCVCDCNSHKHDCEPCDIEAKTCFDNHCGPTCCNPIVPQNFNVACAIPFAIEANRVFDTMRFQTFTDGTDEHGGPVHFEVEVVEVRGPVPTGAQVGVTIEKICINYDDIFIDPGYTTLEDYEVVPLQHKHGENCQSNFEYAVCGVKNNECCKQGKGTSVSYKQRGLVVEVEGLVLELRGSCGCTEFVALAYPVSRRDSKKCREERVRFVFNTLSAPICVPSNGRPFNLRQSYQTGLTVDCIGKSFLSCCCHEGERHYELDIPNGIDVICCLEEIVSVLIGEQIVVLGAPQAIEPRVVDTFSKVCDFSDCSVNTTKPANNSCGCHK